MRCFHSRHAWLGKPLGYGPFHRSSSAKARKLLQSTLDSNSLAAQSLQCLVRHRPRRPLLPQLPAFSVFIPSPSRNLRRALSLDFGPLHLHAWEWGMRKKTRGEVTLTPCRMGSGPREGETASSRGFEERLYEAMGPREMDHDDGKRSEREAGAACGMSVSPGCRASDVLKIYLILGCNFIFGNLKICFIIQIIERKPPQRSSWEDKGKSTSKLSCEAFFRKPGLHLGPVDSIMGWTPSSGALLGTAMEPHTLPP